MTVQPGWSDCELWKDALSDMFLFFNIAQLNFHVTHDCLLREPPGNWYELLLHSIPKGLSCWPHAGVSIVFRVLKLPGLMPLPSVPGVATSGTASRLQVLLARLSPCPLSYSRGQLSLPLPHFVLFCPM